ncbi:MAG: 16S rRNA (cytosine(1402)-N(4))-methyltransferase [Bdellovibrionales bacterium RIFOXYD12_FULL_39_22]|nr:MAG: 16S rRNA (cytosine(1402)-N(4))-methyltransferase [Bdellovibrionales bacterium RIFOXYB1_FULL_39_21]OFZ41394.1 MAG: 16S rRNA (cytosine(1402)-N(4))-methyltransferase [Bdellovibrionales bacterium RIFOXYC12_FULL_39_17]OFZ45349.1 MAG: 16S rRNA (cytosine(1402)-N(4))-methyltransferase [Bdellovibrionales bacterium RIFOXYC1_FULL_39_130]OFZ74545.1 MAG: 16S rRNA (cytosine(1402)-N(4))-methyltransferase [Bdellovibrionales bacterium RIFOXYD1_FULL_39_84]OFZ92554.1 MAG: 16S rRNA (cytosine(1402)-N(4))-me
MNSEYGQHISVLLQESLDYLLGKISPEDSSVKYFADLTFGRGGHSLALSQRNSSIQLICLDQDPEAIENGKAMIAEKNLSTRITLHHANFRNFKKIVETNHLEIMQGHGGFDGILIDLGVSSHQFDTGERGFSFRFDGPLDMRMNPDDGGELNSFSTAAELIKNSTQEDLTKIFFEYGEEKFAKRIAQKICEERKVREIKTTNDLEEIIFHCYPKAMRHEKIHPATRVFQALRIAVNHELEIIEEMIPILAQMLCVGGRLAIISFHSLEDRIVKHSMRNLEKNEEIGRVLTKKPIIPSNEEILRNSRARSAKMRVLERL